VIKLKSVLSLSLIFLINFSAFPAYAFLLPGNTNGGVPKTNVSDSSLGSFLASSGNLGNDRNQMGTDNKKEDKVPKVDINMTPSHPRVGDMIYAQALTQNFRNSSIKLYYNWYIYNPDPKIGSIVVKNGQKIFVSSNTLEGALVRGAMAQVRGSYVPGLTPMAKDGGKANEDPKNDRDGYRVNYGGDDGQGGIDKKIEDILGKNHDFTYEDFKSNCKQNCETEYDNLKSENEWKYNKCAEPTCGDWINQCCSDSKSEFSSCISNVWDDLQSSCFDQICDKKNKDKKEDCYRTLSLKDYANCDSSFFNQETKCTDERNLYCLNKGSCGSKPSQDCTECEKDYHNNQWEALKEKDYCEKNCETKDSNFLGDNSIEPVGTRCYRYNFGGKEVNSHLIGVFQPMTCTHFSPGAKNPDNTIKWNDIVPFMTGDGSFKDDEETFWGTDPSNADTDGDGFPDEADVAGMGQQTIQFKYNSGDKLGVVVEGTSLFPTNEKTTFYKIMWASPGICTQEAINNASKETPEFNNFCQCDDKNDKTCKDSKDFGFGFLKLNDIWESTDNSQNDRLDTFINLLPLRPAVHNPLTMEAVVAGNELDKDMLSYEWTLKHGEDVLRPENDQKNGRIIWKKQGEEVAYTNLSNKSANFKDLGGIGWNKLNLDPLLEGGYSAIAKISETMNNKQRVGEASIKFNVSESLRIRFYRASFNNGIWEKKDELTDNKAITGDTIIAEYEGPFYDDFAWYIGKKKLEGNGPSISFAVNEAANYSYNFKLIASNRNHTNIVEKEASLNVVNPYVTIKSLEETKDNTDSGNNDKQENKRIFTYKVPLGANLEFVALKNPLGSSFLVRNDLNYFWSFDEEDPVKGMETYQVFLDSNKYLANTSHNLAVKVFTNEKQLLAEDKVTLVPTKDKKAATIEDNQHSIGGLAFAYLNVSEKIRFLMQTLLWVFFIYLLLGGIAWLAPIKKNNR